MQTATVVFLICCALIAAATVTYMFFAIRKLSRLFAIYADSARDYRFAYSLMKLYYKKAVLRSVYLLKAGDNNIPPKADVVAVLKGGVVVITVVDKKGFFVTLPEESWTVTNNGVTEEIPNFAKIGKRYTAEIDDILMKAGIPSQNIYNIVLLSDDHASYDELYSDNVMTGDMLIPFCQNLCSAPIMNGRTQKNIIDAIMRRHKICKGYAEKNIYNTLSFSDNDFLLSLLDDAGEEVPSQENAQPSIKDSSGNDDNSKDLQE